MIAPLSRATVERYNRRLARRHPFVRVRWSHYRGAFVLEERMGHSREIDPHAYPEDATDAYIQHRDGYATIQFLRALPPPVVLADGLDASRVRAVMSRLGVESADEWADRLDGAHAARIDAENARFLDHVGEVASDEYDRAQWRTGSRAGGHLRGF